MKVPQTEPYQRSRHRAALQAWVVAATAVASIGMPSAAFALQRENESQQVSIESDEDTPAKAAKRTAASWLALLKKGDVGAALNAMRLPREGHNEQDVIDEVSALSDWLREADAPIEPVAVQQAGHWALSAWRLGDDALIEPITLYHPASDGLDTSAGDWQVVPQHMETDPALAPLFNTDHDALMDWYQTLA